ncbi:hypothetical protein FRC10_003425 [Ceratobasidium sp. 414]|nr:hypothetical protein FRC10_003425 [Ceratobasidium sp. 414]
MSRPRPPLHGQVTLVPPVNQGRTRKVRRRRNPDAAASTTSLVEPGARPGPSRLDDEPSPHRSPRRPRQGSETRAVPSHGAHPSPYPDYPPPSFEEVLALDRQATSLNVSIRPLVQEPTQPESSAQPLSSPAAGTHVLSPGTPRASATPTTPWEEDRRLGLSLEERVRRELKRNLKSGIGESSPKLTVETSSSLPPNEIPPAPSSGTPTSVAESNFLTPQNLTPSPLGVPLPFSTRTSPRVDTSALRSPSPPTVPPKSPALSLPPTPGANQPARVEDPATLDVASVTKSQAVDPLDRLGQANSTRVSSHDEQVATPQPAVQTISCGSPPKNPTSLAPLLFTTRLNLDGPPGPEPSATRRVEQILGPDHTKDAPQTPSNSKGIPKEIVNEPPAIPAVAVERAATPRAASPRKVLTKSRPLSELPTAVNGTSLLFQPPAPRRPPPPKPPSLTNLNAEIAPSIPLPPNPTADSPPVGTPPTALRRPPPPPPPRPRPRSMGAGVAARISAYEAILVNAPKVPPPVPPRPRERQQAFFSTSKSGVAQEATGVDVGGINPPEQTAGDTHIADLPKPRPISLFVPEPGPPRIRAVSGSRPLSMPPTPSARNPSPERTKRDPSPERPKSPTKQAQALVPARIGPDGILEIIPDAEVIWLDETKADPKGGDEYSNIRLESSNTQVVDEQRHVAITVPVEAIAGPSTRRIPVLPPGTPPAGSPNTGPDHMSVERITTNPFSSPTDFAPLTPPIMPVAGQPTATPRPVSSPRLADDFEYTDLDLLISRLEENEASRQGANYEQLLTIGEVLGPAAPRTRAELDLNVGLVEIQRRRVMKDGRVKLKLSLMGVSVDRCGVCLAQFKSFPYSSER